MKSAAERIAWPDAARGIAIALVVFHHAVQFTGAEGLAEPAWGVLSEGVRTMRMPLFFLAAGLFAGKWMRAPWRDLIRSKVLLFGWVFALWVVLRWIVYALVPGYDEESGILVLLLHFVWPIGGWFIFALAIFFVLARATAWIDRRIQLAIAVAMSIVGFAQIVPIDNRAYEGILLFYVFFVFGCWWRSWITARVEGLRWYVGAVIVVGWLAATGVLGVLGWGDVPVLGFALRVLGLAAGVVLAVWFSRLLWLRALGRETLPIYMVHSLVLLVVTTALVALGAARWTAVGWWLPPALGVFALLVSWGIGRAAPRVGAAWLFDTPRWLRRTYDRVTEPRSTPPAAPEDSAETAAPPAAAARVTRPSGRPGRARPGS